MQIRLGHLPIVESFIRLVNRDSQKYSIQETMLRAVVRSKTKLKIYGNTEKLEKILKTQPVAIVANHPHAVDIVALLASLPERNDTSLIISSRFMNIIPNIDKYLIPVYIEHHVKSFRGNYLPEKFLKTFHSIKTYSAAEEHQKNIESIILASKKISEGGLVIIFPKPFEIPKKSNTWFSGVGHMLHNIKTTRKVFVVKAYLENTSNLDFIRIFPQVGKLLGTVKITFSEATQVNEILDFDGKKITSILEEDYDDWTKELKKPNT